MKRVSLAGLAGLVSGGAALVAAETTAVVLHPGSGPLAAVGGAVIDATPTAVKTWAIRRFGTDDKAVLLVGMLLVLALCAFCWGALGLRRRWAAPAGALLLAALGMIAALTRPDSRSVAEAVPSLVGGAVGTWLLLHLIGRLDGPRGTPVSPGSGSEAHWDRRGFVASATVAAAASVGASVLARSLGEARAGDALASRAALELPAAGSPAKPVAEGVERRVPGTKPFLTPTRDFYRVDTALVVPRVDAGTWRLRLRGTGVRRPLRLSFADLLDRELVERDITLTCVSNEIGGPYVGNARWIGVRLADLLREAGVAPPSRGGPADQLVSRSVDGMTLGTPLEDVMDGRDALLAVGMNGEPLPFAHGFPARMVVPGLYGYVSACKWVTDLELTTFADYDPYWVKRGWARRAPVKTQSRIDTPKPFARPRSGTVMVAGVAWAQRRGVERVELRVDDGPWRTVDLAEEHTRDTWRQWSFPWAATPGNHTLTVRATDGTGERQTRRRAPTVPDGASGWHSVIVTVD
ncbi:molybdopterin-dependent oxidoreductase [Streptomyces sp. HSG2]|uniref:molybdopterin-dependent oxidoreductase n=1 Tax=Streptomyces sp. HSG2 TaxID=2797167 RepID=UPI001F5B2354|nr:molybdopterin-dependent oxidoreductase [Streptomyces sp. HSG2]